MAFRYGNREQCSLLPPSIDEYVGSKDPIRAYDAFLLRAYSRLFEK